MSARILSVATLLALSWPLAAPVGAQTIYRIVGPDGKVTFSDKPPAGQAAVTATQGAPRSAAAAGPALPFELRQVVARYPVTLYGSPNCAPCNAGRLMLQARGIPYNEYAITTPEDNEALRRLSGDNLLPVLTIGAQRIKGFSDSEWNQFLDAANYPRSSMLPSTYRFASARPLVAAQRPEPPKAEEETAARTDAPAAEAPAATSVPAVNPSNPAGIRF